MTKKALHSYVNRLRRLDNSSGENSIMEYFISHIPAIIFGAIVVAGVATLWQILTVKNSESRRKKMQGRKKNNSKKD